MLVDIAMPLLTLLTYVPEYYFPEYIEEMRGIAYALAIPKGVVVGLNYLYEYVTFCSSAIIRMQDGTIVHNRNLDFAFRDEM